MNIIAVSTILNGAGLGPPVLNLLIPNESNYSTLLFQPHGQIEAGVAGVHNRNRDLARIQFRRFLDDAHQTEADLVITPEYSMPWEVLIESLKAGLAPAMGKLWVLGCESIKYSELATVQKELSPLATMLYESQAPDDGRFTDPLAYIFLAPPSDGHGSSRLVLLLQFKTFPMGDKDHFEVNGLQRGTCVYRFGGTGSDLRLLTLICSDAFDFLDADANDNYDRALVIHMQLNPKPRHDQYRLYRDRLLRFQGDQTELICLNWASDVEEWCNDKAKYWANVAASAWYLKPDKFDERDETLSANHRRGLYYTWLRPLFTHALFFNYKPATYLLQASKVAHIGVAAAVSRRRGPQLSKTSVWDNASSAWIEQQRADDGFATLVPESGDARQELKRIADENPIATERILALCAGELQNNEDWHTVRFLDSCAIDATEIIHRLTFCQDTDKSAENFRIARLKRCGNLWRILTTPAQLPPALADLSDGFGFGWSATAPHQNAVSLSNGKRATVIYMGEESTIGQIGKVFNFAAAFLQRTFADRNKSHDARQRLAVWYRGGHGDIERYEPDRFVTFTEPGQARELDVAREA